MEALKNILKPYGKIDVCGYVGSQFIVKISNGFASSANNTFEVMRLIVINVPDFPIVDFLVTDDNLFHLILKRKTDE